MRDEPVNPLPGLRSTSGSQADLAAALTELDRRVVRALEVAPEMQVPAGFAARVASRLPVRHAGSATPTYYGRNAMWACSVILLAALLALAPREGAHSALGLAIEWLLCAQLIAFTLWLSIRYRKAG
jgi:hypothetical protein